MIEPLSTSARRYVATQYCVIPHEGDFAIYTGGQARMFCGILPADELASFFEAAWREAEADHEARKTRVVPRDDIPTFTLDDILGALK